MRSETFEVSTGERLVTDLTATVSEFVTGEGDGLLNVFVPHATAGVALIETGSGTEPDLAAAIDRILPREDIYRHRHGSTGHGRDHVLPAFIGPSLTIPVVGGRLALGTWQSVVLVDPNVDNPQRTVRLSLLGGMMEA
jgi:secondary thiamine-phosphate synthase enzyme